LNQPASILPITKVLPAKPKSQGITPAQAQKILQESGKTVTLEQAAKMVEFLYNLAKTTQA